MRKLFLALTLSAAVSHAANIVSITGTGGGFCVSSDTGLGGGSAAPEIWAGSWTMPFSATGVTITVHLHNSSASSQQATAYLSTTLGPGTTAINSQALTVPGAAGGTDADYTFFTGLNLAAGTYDLTLISAANCPVTWSGLSSQTLATGVTVQFANESVLSSVNVSNPPASTFAGPQAGFQLAYSVRKLHVADTNADTHSNSDSNTDANSHSNADSDPHRNPHANPGSNSDANAHPNSDANSHAGPNSGAPGNAHTALRHPGIDGTCQPRTLRGEEKALASLSSEAGRTHAHKCAGRGTHHSRPLARRQSATPNEIG